MLTDKINKQFSSGEKIHIAGVNNINVCFFEFAPLSFFLTEKLTN